VAVSVILHLGGDPDDLLARYDAGWPLTPRPDEPGLIYHACLRLRAGIKVILHFHTEATARGFLDRQEVQACLDELTMVDGRPAIVPIHAYAFAPSVARS
jgi:hypothetical protein